MNKPIQKLQVISNYPQILNRNEVLSQQQKNRKAHARVLSQTQVNLKPGFHQRLNSQNDLRSTHTTQQDQINISRVEDGEEENDQNKSIIEEDDQNISKYKRINNNSTSFHKTNNINQSQLSINKNQPIKIFSPSQRQRSSLTNSYYYASNKNTPKSNQDKRQFFQNMKSKSTIAGQNVRRQSDISQFLNTQKFEGYQSPNSNDMSTPKWNHQQLNNLNHSDSFYVAKSNYDIIKNQNVKLQKNYELMRDQVIQALSLLEEEFKNQGKKEIEYKKYREMIQQLVNLLSESAKNELKLAISNTQQMEKQEQNAQLKSKIESLQQQIHHITSENKKLLQLKQENENEILQKNRELIQNDKKMKADKRKIEQLEKRLGLLLETNFVEYAADRQAIASSQKESRSSSPVVSTTQIGEMVKPQNLRILLSDLVKDNEQLKKDTLSLEIDILRSTENESKLNKKIQILNQKIESMKKKISAKDLEQLQLEEKSSQQIQNHELLQQQNSTNLLKRQIIPLDADFRINSMKFEYSNILMELIEHGSNNFALHVSRNKNADRRTKLISLMANQFISYRDFSNRFIQIVKLLHEFEQMDDLTKIQQKAETTRLWISDSITGILYTYNVEQKRQNCLPGKGVFQDVIRGKLPINMKNQISNRYIYIHMNELCDNFSNQIIQSTANAQSNSLQVYNCLTSFCVPLIIGEDVVGILEISDNNKSDGFGQDEELFGVVCANFFSEMIKKIKLSREQILQIKYSDVLYDAFQSCLDSENLLILERKVHQQVQNIFGVEVCKFYYVKETEQTSKGQQIQQPQGSEVNFSSFYSLVYQNAYSYKKGLIGEAITTMKPILINSASNSSNYDPFVDVKTLLPIYTTPLFLKNEKNSTLICIGVLQIPLKKRTQIALEKDKLLLGSTPILGIDNSLENQIKIYSNLLANAIKSVQLKQQK